MKKIIIPSSIILVLLLTAWLIAPYSKRYFERNTVYPTYHPEALLGVPTSSAHTGSVASSTPLSMEHLPASKILPMKYHTFQTFNNCGPASLAMALSYFGIDKNQEELGKALRPYQVKNGDNDDKSVTLEELKNKAQQYNLLAYHRPGGDVDTIKKFIAQGVPVITVTLLKKDDDIGHYRLVRGYDDKQSVFIQDDSFQGKNLVYTYQDFNFLWSKFNYEYLVLSPKEKEVAVMSILGENLNEEKAWETARSLALTALASDKDSISDRFNLSVAYYHLGQYQESIDEFEKVQSRLPLRTLWYQIEPLQSYFELGQYDKVFFLSDSILSNHNRAFSELYILRGRVYLKQGKKELAREEFKKAVIYNENLEEAKNLLSTTYSN